MFWPPLHAFVEQNTVLAVFLAILSGTVLGRLHLGGVSLGNSAVLFVAAAFGQFRLLHPEGVADLGRLGIALFAYAVGLQAGPRFVQTFRRSGGSLIQTGLAAVFGAAVIAFAAARVLGIGGDLVAGLFAGALTSTPALAAAMEASRSPLVSVGYGIAYPFGVVAVVLFAQLLPRWLASFDQRADRKPDVSHEPILRRCFRLENPSLVGRSTRFLNLHQMIDANVSRVLRGTTVLAAAASQLVLQRGDILLAVGTDSQLRRLESVIGPVVEADLSRSADVIARDVLITEHSVAGRPIDAVAIPERYGVVITRVRRDAIEFVPKGDFVLEIGDQVRVVGQEPEVLAFAEKAGVNERRIHETGLATFFAGLVLGTLLGLVGLPLPWGGTFRLGLAGGPLLAGLVLGHFGRIGRFHIHVPPAARYLLRELGLVFFLVSAGTAAGAEAVPVILSQGLRSVLLAVLIVLTAMGTAFALAYVVFRHSTAATVGVTCGAMTSTPGLGAASHQFDNDVPALTYATVYPFALVFKTALVQVLIGLLS